MVIGKTENKLLVSPIILPARVKFPWKGNEKKKEESGE
jgi:hypothetical protein